MPRLQQWQESNLDASRTGTYYLSRGRVEAGWEGEEGTGVGDGRERAQAVYVAAGGLEF